MCMHCEATGVPAVTVGMKTFATLDEALEYARPIEYKYNTQKTLIALHTLGLVDLQKP